MHNVTGLNMDFFKYARGSLMYIAMDEIEELEKIMTVYDKKPGKLIKYYTDIRDDLDEGAKSLYLEYDGDDTDIISFTKGVINITFT